MSRSSSGFSRLAQKYNARKASSPAQSQPEPGSLGAPEMLLKAALGILALFPILLHQSRTYSHCYLEFSISIALLNSTDQEELEQGREANMEKSRAEALCQPWATLADSAEPTKCLQGVYLGQSGLQHPRQCIRTLQQGKFCPI